jgi:hypothetical protein
MTEVLQLKTELLRHTDCNCVLIQRYIAHEAKRTVDNITGVSDRPSQWSQTFTSSSRGSIDYGSISPTTQEPPNNGRCSKQWDQAHHAHGGAPHADYSIRNKLQNQYVPSPTEIEPPSQTQTGYFGPEYENNLNMNLNMNMHQQTIPCEVSGVNWY